MQRHAQNFLIECVENYLIFLVRFSFYSLEKAKLHRDPTYTQHRYEDLLEGAISLYSIETTEYHTIETITKEEFPEILIGKDMRGKSADMFVK